MVDGKNLIRKRLVVAIRSIHEHRDEKDVVTRVRYAGLWHEDCYGYITAMFDLHLINWNDYMFYVKINDRVRDLAY